jgi:hypothetical protein
MIAALLILTALVFVCPAHAAFVDMNAVLNIPGCIGAAWGDYDGDGYPDLAIVGNQALGYGVAVLHNEHGFTFTDVRDELGLPLTFNGEITPAWADYDNDGKLDLFVASDGLLDKLYDNSGSAFADMATEAGFTDFIGTGHAARTVSWGDYDNDNLLDVFICQTLPGGISRLCHNNGDGTFTDATDEAGLTLLAAAEAGNCSAWADYDNDGWLDLLVTRMQRRPMLYHNNHDGTFTEVGAASFSAIPDSTGVAWADYDNDGWLDCYIASQTQTRDWLFHNNGDGTFTEVGETAGLAGDGSWADGVAWADYDNDGHIDLFVGNVETSNQPFLYHNNGNGTFTNVASSAGVGGSIPSEAVCWADLDVDGKMDLFQGAGAPLSRLFYNIGPAGNWLRVRTLTSATGDATGSDPVRDAIGARVDLNLDNDDAFLSGRTLARLIDGGSGFCSQNEQIAQFGLGSANLVAVRVRFLDGSIVVHRSVPANQQITIRDVPAGRTEIFDDVPLDFWAYSQTKACVDAGIVSGYDDALYHPEYAVTRDQMAVYISRALAGGDIPEFVGTPTFPDVDETHWALKYVEFAVDEAVVTGYDDGKYHPEYEVNRAQMAVYVARSMVAPTGEAALADYVPADPRNFPDVASGFWAYKHIEYCVEDGVVNGYADGLYHPEIIVTRDQMAVYVARAFGL